MSEDKDKILSLTRREAETMYWICKGKSLSECSREMDIGRPNVTANLRKVYERLGIDSDLLPEEKRNILYEKYCPILMEICDDEEIFPW